jgi:photosystem II stability/assembly factor-like uncharacterized protein
MTSIRISLPPWVLIAFSLVSFSACTNQEPENSQPSESEAPSLRILSLFQYSVWRGDSAFIPGPIALSPDFKPEVLEYTVKARRGVLVVTHAAPILHQGVTVTFDGVALPESIGIEGNRSYKMEFASKGVIEAIVLDSIKDSLRTYRILVDVRPDVVILDPDAPSFKAMSLAQAFYYRGTYFKPMQMKPEFHPDTLDYFAEDSKGASLRLVTTAENPATRMDVELNGSIVQGANWGNNQFAFNVRLDSNCRFEATLTDPANGKSRIYSVSLNIKLPVNTGEWSILPMMKGRYDFSFFIDSTVGYVYGDSGLHKTTDGGKTWEMESFAKDQSLNSIDFANAETGLIVGSAGLLLKTTDGGRNWVRLQTRFDLGISDVSFPSAKIAYILAGTDEGMSVFKSGDGGITWVEKLTGYRYGFNDIEFVDSSHGFIAGIHGKILKTKDGGDSWEVISKGLDSTTSFRQLDVLDSNILIAGSGSDLFRTLDGGLSWKKLAVPSHHSIHGFDFTGPETGYLVATGTTVGSSILKTIDGGENWVTQYYGHSLFRMVEFPTDNTGFAYGFDGMMKLGK